jgi:hypothetical protein
MICRLHAKALTSCCTHTLLCFFPQGVTRTFSSRQAAETYAKRELGAFEPPSTGSGQQNVLKIMARVYDIKHRQFMPADLLDCCARHVADADLFRMEPGAELISIMLKYAPVRAIFSHELRKVVTVTGSDDDRAKRLWKALHATVLQASKQKFTEQLQLWGQHWGRNVQHHSGWLAFLQRTSCHNALHSIHTQSAKCRQWPTLTLRCSTHICKVGGAPREWSSHWYW